MDLQEILNASDSSDEGDHHHHHHHHVYSSPYYRSTSSELANRQHAIDLEQILREDDDLDYDDDDYDDYDNNDHHHYNDRHRLVLNGNNDHTNGNGHIDNTAIGGVWDGSSNRNGHGVSSKYIEQQKQHLWVDPDSEYHEQQLMNPHHHQNSRTTTRNSTRNNNNYLAPSHNGEDWAVLQAILHEEDDYDESNHHDDDEWLNASSGINRSFHSSNQSTSDIYIQSTNDLGNDDGMGEDFEDSSTLSATLPTVSTLSSPVRPKMSHDSDHLLNDHALPESAPEMREFSSMSRAMPSVEANGGEERSVVDIRPLSKIIQHDIVVSTTPSNRLDERTEEEISRRSLVQAMSYEKRLLKSGHREIVSPLMVKRRLKPKMELTSRGSSKKRQQSTLERSSSVSCPKFGFSGIVENKPMVGVSESLVKHAAMGAKVLCGLPTCLAFNSKFMAVGTQLGIILIYDLFEVLRQRLGTRLSEDNGLNSKKAGSITSLDLSHNGDTVVAGYTSGLLVLWDTIRGVVLRAVHDAHPSPITSVRFLGELKMVTVDAGGLVNKLTFNKNMLWSTYSMESECLLDGTAGQILAMNVLSPYSSVKPMVRPEAFSRVLRRLTLIALSSERSSFAVAVEPSVNVLHRWAKPPNERIDVIDNSIHIPPAYTYLPCLSWGWALISGGGNVVMPILARAWGCCLQLLVASFPSLDDSLDGGQDTSIHWPAFGMHDEIDAGKPVVALEWLSERSLVYLTVTNEFTLVDTVMLTMLERLDFTKLKLVYAEFALSRSGSAIGQNDSKDYTGGTTSTTFQNSIRCSDDRLLVLCQDELICISVVGARRRISSLEEDGEWLEALALALDHYESTVVSQEDRRRDPNGGKDLSRHPEFSSAKTDDEEWIAKLLVRYLNLAVENAPESSIEANPYGPAGMQTRIDLAQSHFQMLAGVCVEYCVVTRRLDMLFGPIFRRFQSVGYTAVFLDVLEPYVLNDKLAYIAPEVMSFFVEHCKATNGVATVERCLLHMDCTIMDFDSILSLLRRNDMFTALFYVFNNGLDDFITPLEILLEKVFDDADAGSATLPRRRDGVPQNDFERLGYKGIWYLQICFRGKTFPQESELVPEERQHTLKKQLLQFLVQVRFNPSAFVRKATDISFTNGLRGMSYPYFRLFLQVDPREMLKTLSLALDRTDPMEAGSRATSERADDWVNGDSSYSLTMPSKQEIMRILASILLPPSESPVAPHSRSAINAFLDFTAKYIMDGAVQVDNTVTYMILKRMSDQYAKEKDPGARQQSQRQVLNLLSALPRDSYDPDQVLALINRAGIHRAALLLHQQVASAWREVGLGNVEECSRHFRSAVDCYLEDEDESFKRNVFEYVRKECSGVAEVSKAEDGEKPKTLRESLFSKLPALVRLDALMTARLVAELFVDDLDSVVASLGAEESGNGQFLFLQAIISGELVQVDPVARSVLNLTMEHHHIYLSLMAKLHPDMVYDYLSTHDNYRAEDCLRLCQEYDIADASAYLLERMGNVSSALQLILQTLESRMMTLKRTIRGLGIDRFRAQSNRLHPYVRSSDGFLALLPPSKKERDVDGVKRILVVALDLCERNSGSFTSSSEHGSQLWFNVLDRLINAKGFLRLSKEQPVHANVMSGVLSELLRLTMQRMVSSVPLTDLVRKVTSDHSGSRLGELREMVESLLGTYGFELNVFEGAVTVFHQDVRSMRIKQHELQLGGAMVQVIGNRPLACESATEVGDLLQHQSRRDSCLRVGVAGRATFSDKQHRTTHSQETQSGLANALGRLRGRRSGRGNSPRENPLSATGASSALLEDQGAFGQRAPATLNVMTATERLFQDHQTEPVVMYGRPIGALGGAQHRGRLMKFD